MGLPFGFAGLKQLEMRDCYEIESGQIPRENKAMSVVRARGLRDCREKMRKYKILPGEQRSSDPAKAG